MASAPLRREGEDALEWRAPPACFFAEWRGRLKAFSVSCSTILKPFFVRALPGGVDCGRPRLMTFPSLKANTASEKRSRAMPASACSSLELSTAFLTPATLILAALEAEDTDTEN